MRRYYVTSFRCLPRFLTSWNQLPEHWTSNRDGQRATCEVLVAPCHAAVALLTLLSPALLGAPLKFLVVWPLERVLIWPGELLQNSLSPNPAFEQLDGAKWIP